MAAVRSIMSVAGRNKLADPSHEKLSNQALGISGASRDGTKTPLPDDKLAAIVSYAFKKDEGVAIGVQLSRYLGLRTEETVQSAKSLKTWKKAILNGNDRVKVIFGTKGGRDREITVFNREKVLSILDKAIKHCGENRGKLIDKPSLHTAIER